MDNDNTLMTRLDGVEQRLAAHSRAAAPAGLTEPDEGADERWEAGQVWAHIAEFVPYWHGQMRRVVEGFAGTPVPFGRSKTDAIRTDPIEANRNEPIAAQMASTDASIDALKRYLGALSGPQWHSIGVHPRRGEMSVHDILEEFVIKHLEEHADQLDGLKAT